MALLKPLASLCLLTLVLGCGSQKTETNQAESKEAQQQNATTSSLSSPFEALPSHPRFELSDLRFPSPDSFTVTWRLASGSTGNTWGDWSLAVKPSGDSFPTSLPVNFWDDTATGEISGELRSFGGGSTGTNLEAGCEVFMTVYEGGQTFKLSNSLTSGSSSVTSAHPAGQEVAAQIEKHRQERRAERDQKLATDQASQEQKPTVPTPTPAPTKPGGPTRTVRPPGYVAVPPTGPLPNGTELMAMRDENQWIAATVVGERADGFVQVQWKDNSGTPDEFLHRAKLAIRPGTLARLRSRRP